MLLLTVVAVGAAIVQLTASPTDVNGLQLCADTSGCATARWRCTGSAVWNGMDVHHHSSGDHCCRCLVAIETLPLPPAIQQRAHSILRLSSRQGPGWYSSCSTTTCRGHDTHIAVILLAVHWSRGRLLCEFDASVRWLVFCEFYLMCRSTVYFVRIKRFLFITSHLLAISDYMSQWVVYYMVGMRPVPGSYRPTAVMYIQFHSLCYWACLMTPSPSQSALCQHLHFFIYLSSGNIIVWH